MREEFYKWTLLTLTFFFLCSLLRYIFTSGPNLTREVYTTEANGAICAGPWHYDNTEGKTL